MLHIESVSGSKLSIELHQGFIIRSEIFFACWMGRILEMVVLRVFFRPHSSLALLFAGNIFITVANWPSCICDNLIANTGVAWFDIWWLKFEKKDGEVQSSNTQYGPFINILRNVGNKLWYTFSVTGTMWQIYDSIWSQNMFLMSKPSKSQFVSFCVRQSMDGVISNISQNITAQRV